MALAGLDLSRNLKSILTLVLVLALTAAGAARADESAQLYQQGLDAFEDGNYDRAYVLWKPLAENGFAVAQYSLGKLFDRGGGAIQENPFMAALWYRQAAAQGVAAAQNNLAIMYTRGRGVPRNEARAVELWSLAADQGHAVAQFNLGLSLFNGAGITADPAAAIVWFEQAGEQNVADAQFALGQIYREGAGVTKDPVKALGWYRRAAALGHAEAASEAAQLGTVAQSTAPLEESEEPEASPPEEAIEPEAFVENLPSPPDDPLEVDDPAQDTAIEPLPEQFAEAPAPETPAPETVVTESPPSETPEVETPEAETPEVETPEVETPVVETPVVETPVVETPVVETTVLEPSEPETGQPQSQGAVDDQQQENDPAPVASVAQDATAPQVALLSQDLAETQEVAADEAPADKVAEVTSAALDQEDEVEPEIVADPAVADEQPEAEEEGLGAIGDDEAVSLQMEISDLAPRRKPETLPIYIPNQIARVRQGDAAQTQPPTQAEASGAFGTSQESTVGQVQLAALPPLPDFPSGSYSLWLASTADAADAQAFWRLAVTSYPDLFGSVSGGVRRVDLQDLGVYYRVIAGHWLDKEEAARVCRQLRQAQPDAFCKTQRN